MSAKLDRISRYREILKADPRSRVYVPLADLLQQHGETEEALVLLEEGLVRDPEHQSAMVVLGCTLLQAGRQEHGVKVLQRVLELSPENFVVLRILAEYFLAMDAFTHAIPLLERLVDFEPDQTQWANFLNDARDRLALDQAAPSETDDTESQPVSDQSLATMTLVDILVSQGYLDKAVVALQRMRDQDPDRVDVQERLAQLQSGVLAPASVQPPDNETSAEDRFRRRAGQKKQFGDWIESFKSDSDPSS